MKTLHVFSGHFGLGGGEKYINSLLNALCPHFDIMVDFDPVDPLQYNPISQNLIKTYLGDDVNYISTVIEGKPDVFLNYSHFNLMEPRGRYNVLLVLFPRPEDRARAVKFDKVITISDYSAEWIDRYWGIKAEVLYPAIDFGPIIDTEKTNAITNISRFFREPDGHCKNQDFLIAQFNEHLPEDWQSWFCGWVFKAKDSIYYRKCFEGTQHDRFRFYLNLTNPDIRELLIRSRVYVHANGYGRKDPAQCEHFGYIFLEALREGCVILSHNSGNTKLSNVTFNDSNDFPNALQKTIELSRGCRMKPLPGIPDCYGIPHFTQEARRLFGV
jgi:hypothetical protein